MLSLDCWRFEAQLLSGDHLQNQVPVAKQFSTLSVRLRLVDWRGLTVSACYYLYSGALVFLYTKLSNMRKGSIWNHKTDFDTMHVYTKLLFC